MTSLFKGGNTDYVVRSAIANISKFFSRGWGSPEILHRLGILQETVLNERKFVREVYGTLEKTEIKISKGKRLNNSMTLYNGEFISPLNTIIPRALPPECEKARFQVILPNKWNNKKPICIQLAGTGDHFFWRRRFFMASPLANECKIGSIILENPFYGNRKPKNQSASAVNYVSDIFVMGAALLLESVVLLLWCQRKGFGPLGITGISMGGHMASVAASGWFEPLSIVPCLSYTSAAPCFTEGVLSHTIHWDVLERQLEEQPEYMNFIRNDAEFKKKLVTHYTNTSYLTELRNEEESQGMFSSHYNQMYLSVSSFVSDIKLWSYIDMQGRKFGSFVVEADLWKYLESLSKQLPNPSLAYKRLDFEIFKNLMWTNYSSHKPSQETLDYMMTIMDQGTHLSHFKKPHEDSSVIFVCAEHDRYMPKECYNLTPKDVWEQSEIRTIDSGHVLAILQHQKYFRDAVRDSFQMLGCN